MYFDTMRVLLKSTRRAFQKEKEKKKRELKDYVVEKTDDTL